MKCPCFSNKNYRECCEPFHKGALPENALQLMRSRYAAYAINLPKYIIDTTHPENSHFESDQEKWVKNISKFCNDFAFTGLEILDFQEEGGEATVTFIAHLEQNRQDASFKEKSLFKKVDGKWLYHCGEISK